jgi:hypothetical protein
MTADYFEDESIIIMYNDNMVEYKDIAVNKCYISNDEVLEFTEEEIKNGDIVASIIDKKNNETKDVCIYKDSKWRCSLATRNLVLRVINIEDLKKIKEIILHVFYYDTN